MKMFTGFKSEAPTTAFPMLPAGTYVAAIKNVKVDGNAPDQQLVLRLDIIEGDQTAYYTRRYEHDSKNAGNYPAKYKGDLRIQIPDPENHKRIHPEWDTKAFNNAMYAIENSNKGIRFDWDAIFAGDFVFLKGKTVGINVRDATYNGASYTTIGRLEVADDVRSGAVKTMPPKKERETPAPEAQPAAAPGFTVVDMDDLPF